MKIVESKAKSSHYKKKFFICLILYLCEMMDVHQTYCDKHFMMYVIIMLCTLNLYSVVCQLYLNKTGRKNKKGSNKQI